MADETTDLREIMRRAWTRHVVIPAFNIPYLPMVAPVVEALARQNAFGLIEVARLEWRKFGAQNQESVRDEYRRHEDRRHTRLHQDHLPVIDEDGVEVDFLAEIALALRLGYDSVMVDGSRLPFSQNVAATKQVVDLARPYGVPVEAELGAVAGHEEGPAPDYETLFAGRKGFTEVSEAAAFVRETGVDWLSVAVGSIHGPISKGVKDKAKVSARLDIDRLSQINGAAGVPLVLHGGSGIPPDIILEAVDNGIAKINIGTEIRQPFEQSVARDTRSAQSAVREAVLQIIERLHIAGTASLLCDGV